MPIMRLLVPTYVQMLTALSAWLDKAGAKFAPSEEFLSERLAADMFPLSTQVRFACFQAHEAVYRLRGEVVPEAVMAIADEGRNAGDAPGTLADAQTCLRETVAFLETLSGDALDDNGDRAIALDLPTGMIFDMTGDQYVRDWALPQFYFHLNAAYAILRQQGVALGKADYVQHAMAYLRPGTMPGG